MNKLIVKIEDDVYSNNDQYHIFNNERDIEDWFESQNCVITKLKINEGYINYTTSINTYEKASVYWAKSH